MATLNHSEKKTYPQLSRLVPYVREALSISQEQMGRLLKVSGRSVARWEKEKTGPKKGVQKELLKRLYEIAVLGSKIYTAEGLNEFLSTPLSVFGGRTGYDLIFLGEHQRVLGALAADYEGLGT